MDLLDLNYKQVIDVFMHDQLGQRMLVLAMRVAQADLLVVFTVEADRSVIEVLNEVLKSDPEDAIKIIVDTYVILQVLL